MKLKNTAFMFCVFVILGTFFVSRPIYAANPNTLGEESKDAVDRELPNVNKGPEEKGSLWSAVRTLSQIDFYKDQGVITPEEHEDYVNKGVMTRDTFDRLRKAAGDWSGTTTDREIRELKDIGVIQEDQSGGKYVFSSKVGSAKLDQVLADNKPLVDIMDRGSGVKRLDATEIANIKGALGIEATGAKATEKVEVAQGPTATSNIAALSGDATIKTVPFSARYAEESPEQLLKDIDMLRPDQTAVIITSPGYDYRANITNPDLISRISSGDIHMEAVAPNSIAGNQFAEAFRNNNFVGLEQSITEMRSAIEKNEGLN